MRRLLVLGLMTVLGVVGTGCAADLQKADTEARLAQLGARAVAQDFRVVFHLEKDATICGGTGDFFVGQVEMNNRERFLDQDGRVQLRDNWVRVDKSYAVSAAELNAPYFPLLGSDSCLE
jgi:hypothetical protein